MKHGLSIPGTEVPAAALPPPRRTTIASVVALLAALLGVAVAIFLVREHLTVTEGGLVEGLLCGGGASFDCNAVAASEYSWMLGVPIALWGLVFYITMSGLALATLLFQPSERAAAASLGVLAACVALVFDAYLAWIMVARIGSVCLGCVTTYGVNLLLAGAFWWIERRARTAPGSRGPLLSPFSPIAKLALAALVLGGIGASAYFTSRSLEDVELLAQEETNEFLAQLAKPPEIDMTRFAGQPSRGPSNAPITIVVTSDFQCSFCRALSANIEKLRAQLPDKIRVVYLNAPVSSKCNPTIDRDTHEDACWLAEIGECAAEQGKFWEYHDYLYHTLPHPQVTQEVVTRHLGAIRLDVPRLQACVERGAGRAALERDIALARELKLLAVPSIVINGHARRGGVYPKMLSNVVRAMLRDAPVAR